MRFDNQVRWSVLPPLLILTKTSVERAPSIHPPHSLMALELELEHGSLRAPVEEFSQAMRARHRHTDKELAAVLTSLRDIKNAPCGRASAVRALVAQLKALKSGVAEQRLAEEGQLALCRARLRHLSSPASDGGGQAGCVKRRVRVHRLVIDYLYRRGHEATASQLASESSVESLVSSTLYSESRALVEALRSRECGGALAWCARHRLKLKKLGSTLEPMLREREFALLLERSLPMEALAHAREHLRPDKASGDEAAGPAAELAAWKGRALRRAMAAVALGPKSCCAVVRELLSGERWAEAAAQLQTDYGRVFAVPDVPPLVTAVGAGLVALQTCECKSAAVWGPASRCPVCFHPYHALAARLPSVQRSQSTLICSLCNLPMGADNQPMVLPGGLVCSQRAVELLRARSADGRLRHPHTHQPVQPEELRKAYFL